MEITEIQKKLLDSIGLPPISWEQWELIKQQCEIAERLGYRLASKSERKFTDPPDLFYPKSMPFLLFVKNKNA